MTRFSHINDDTRPHVKLEELIQHGRSLHNLEMFHQAQTVYEQILAIDPNHFDALRLLATVLAQTGKSADAIVYFERALAIDNTNPIVFNNRGITLQQLKRFDEALESYDQAIRLSPDYADAYNNRGNALNDLHRFEEALLSYESSIRIRPDYIEGLYNRSVALNELKRFIEAVASYDEVIRLRPDHVDTYNNRGLSLSALKQFKEAVLSYDQAIQRQPNYAEAHSNRGIALNELGSFFEAVSSYDEAIRLNPHYAEAYNNRGISLNELKRFEEAIASYDEAIRLKPNYPDALTNRGLSLIELKRFDEALESYEEAIRLHPNHAEAYWNKSLLQILTGDFINGWEHYQWRWQHILKGYLRDYRNPMHPSIERYSDKVFFLYPEQGLGDTIQFCRYAKIIADKGGRVVAEVPKPLRSLIASLDPRIQVIQSGDPIPDFDYHSPLMSLPWVFKTTIDSIPSEKAYLSIPKEKKDRWSKRLGEKSKPRIGLAWSGSSQHSKDMHRSIPFTDIEVLLDLPYEFHCLQPELRQDEYPLLQAYPEVKTHFGMLEDFSDTGALIEHMDCVISVDTSVAHLAGALGKEVWILLSCIPDYRWLLERQDTPWYPGAKLFRQDEKRDWEDLLIKVKNELALMLSLKAG